MSERRSFGQLRRLPSKRWQAFYTGPDVALHYAPSTFETKMDAEAWLVDERRILARGAWLPPTARKQGHSRSMTLAGYAQTWLADRTLKPRTREHYQSLLVKQILPTLGDQPLKALTPLSIRAWHARTGTTTPTLRAHAYGLLRTILASAVQDGITPLNPCHIRGAGTSKRVHKIKPATLHELELITTAMPDRYKLLVLLASWCGLRFGELAELRRGDIDLTNGRIKIRRAVVRSGRQVIVGTPKSDAGTRDVAIPPHLMPMVRKHLTDHVAPARDGLLFPAAGGGHLAPSTLYKSFYRARAAASRDDLRWDDLRHTGAVLAAATGATLPELMARLGHSTQGAALRYQHASQDRDMEIAKLLSAMVNIES
jgi:integrase